LAELDQSLKSQWHYILPADHLFQKNSMASQNAGTNFDNLNAAKDMPLSPPCQDGITQSGPNQTPPTPILNNSNLKEPLLTSTNSL
jgi:hypothetical protein